MNFNCEHCGHNFKQKNDLNRHLKKKNGCLPVGTVLEKSNIANGKIIELHSVFKTCLDILRNDTEHLIGDEALHELSHFLILKSIEKHIVDGSIIFDINLYKDRINDYGEEIFLNNNTLKYMHIYTLALTLKL